MNIVITQTIVRDHLGNVSASFRANDNNTFTLLQEDSYYPFGMQQPSMSYLSRDTEHKNLHLYNGKELQTDFDLNWYDYGARFYDAELVRWHVVDAHAENYFNWSPYNYVYNNPILMIDPDGRDGVVTGKGTKDTPYVITANYYYVKKQLNNEQLQTLNDAIYSYNNMGGKSGFKIKTNGKKVYVKYNLSLKEVDTERDAMIAAYKDKFTDINGETRFFGNTVNNKSRSPGEFGSADARSIGIDSENINNFATANKEVKRLQMLKGSWIHEIGHNLGGEHEDGTSTMSQITRITTNSQINTSSSGNNVSYS